MKMNSTRFFVAIASLLLAAGCAMNDVDNGSTPALRKGASPVFTSSFENAETRTYVDSDLYMYWTADDCLSIFTSSYNEQYRFDGQTGATGGSFSKVTTGQFVTGNPVSANYGIYPYNASTALTKEEKIELELPAVQQYAVNSFGVGANTMVAVTAGTDDFFLPFKNVCGYLVVKLYGDVTVKKVIFEGNNGEKIAGAATVVASHNSNPEITMSAEATTSITIDCGDGVELGKTADTATEFWFVIPPMTFSHGFTIKVEGDDIQQMKKSTTTSRTIQRNVANAMSAIEVIFDTMQPNKIIYYTSYTESIIEPNVSNGFGANIIDNYYLEGKGIIVFDNEVTAIPSYAFQGSQYLESITLPPSTKSIKSNAFDDCELLISINLSDNLEEIGAYAFNKCSNLASIILPSSLRSIGKSSFGYCSSLKAITLPANISTIPDNAFTWCDKMEHITIPNNVTSIGSSAFWACLSLQSITLPTELITLGSNVFYGCHQLESIVIPSSVTSIGDACFDECIKLSSIVLGDSINYLGKGILRGCTQLESIEGKFSTEDKRCLIKDNQLLGFAPKGVTSYSFPSTIKLIGEYSVGGYSDLRTITIPDSVTLIEQYAFGWGNLTTVYIGTGIKAINNSAFIYNSKLENLYCKAVNPPILGSSVFNGHPSSFSIFVPLESVDEYKASQYWSDVADRIQAIPSSSHIVPETVDLGLPSGLKWASFNLGASKAEEYGDYYAWGEIEPYYTPGHSQDQICTSWRIRTNPPITGYNWESYKWCNGTLNSMTKYNTMLSYGNVVDQKTTLDLEDDAARANLGGSWRIPTEADYAELLDNCTTVWTVLKGVSGLLITSKKNNNSIFLPAAGHWYETGLDWYYSGPVSPGSVGFYWSSSLSTDYPYRGRGLNFTSDYIEVGNGHRFIGRSIRPVCD